MDSKYAKDKKTVCIPDPILRELEEEANRQLKGIQVQCDHTYIVAGERQWKDYALSHLGSILRQYGKDSSLINAVPIANFLSLSLLEVGFAKYGSRYVWVSSWGCEVSLRLLDGDLVFLLDGKRHELRDLYPLWGLLRKHWERHAKNRNC